MTGTNPTSLATWAERWKLAAAILGFAVGISILVSDAILNPPADYVTSGFGLILTGLGPAALRDYLKGGA